MRRISFGYVNVSVGPMAAIEYSVLAEKAGFKILWMPDHFVDINGDMLEPWTILSAVATKTKKIRLASSVTDTQRSHPARTAHAVACLDVISGGRAILGIGAGEAMNILPFGLPWGSPSQRTVRLEEAVQVIRLLWSSSRDNPKNFEGQFYKLNRAYLSQSPKQKPCPPIYVGVFASPKALKIVGRWGDGWYSWINTPETFRERWDVIRQSAEAAGRSVSRIEPCSHLMIALPRTRGEEKRALLSGKVLLLMEKHTLRGFGYSADMPQYQHIMTSREDVAEVMAEAEKIPEEYVYKTMSVGGIREIEQKVEGLVKAGVRHFAVADLLAPKTVRRTMTAFSKIIRTA